MQIMAMEMGALGVNSNKLIAGLTKNAISSVDCDTEPIQISDIKLQNEQINRCLLQKNIHSRVTQEDRLNSKIIYIQFSFFRGGGAAPILEPEVPRLAQWLQVNRILII